MSKTITHHGGNTANSEGRMHGTIPLGAWGFRGVRKAGAVGPITDPPQEDRHGWVGVGWDN